MSASLRAALARAQVTSERKTLYKVSLVNHDATGATTHYRDGQLLPEPVSLCLVQYDGDPAYYLLYLDGAGCILTDTYHVRIEDAFAQATFEFSVRKDEWRQITSDEPSRYHAGPGFVDKA